MYGQRNVAAVLNGTVLIENSSKSQSFLKLHHKLTNVTKMVVNLAKVVNLTKFRHVHSSIGGTTVSPFLQENLVN